LEGKYHQEKRHKVLMCDSQNKSCKETPLKSLSRKSTKKALKITEKGKIGSTRKSQRGARMSSKPFIHREERFFTKRLATSHHPTHLKICLEALGSPRRE
jgi:hypothetical protein